MHVPAEADLSLLHAQKLANVFGKLRVHASTKNQQLVHAIGAIIVRPSLEEVPSFRRLPMNANRRRWASKRYHRVSHFDSI